MYWGHVNMTWELIAMSGELVAMHGQSPTESIKPLSKYRYTFNMIYF
jgi:hypothetical protein